MKHSKILKKKFNANIQIKTEEANATTIDFVLNYCLMIIDKIIDFQFKLSFSNNSEFCATRSSILDQFSFRGYNWFF